MSRVKKLTSCLVAVLALAAISASAASAASPAWWVAGNPLATGATEAVAETTTVTEPFVIKAPGFKMECKSVKLEKGSIEGEKTGNAVIIVTNCEVTTQPACIVGTITTKPLKLLLKGTSPNFKLNFEPVSGTEVATVHYSGSGCTLPASVVIAGSMQCNYPGVETEATEHVLEFTTGSGSKLELGGVSITFSGIDRFWLASNKKWSVK
jgi:hypothetical protein